VEKIAHAALIDVDKDGTEAAAASLIEIVFLREIPIAYALKLGSLGAAT
jgi:serine protease inhibitor